ncbi:MAG TPA: 50S ribosomal protein L11 methyltransferase [Gammaproteobacteria bacterium]|nr:50S ribosomal protein L11 methyltransferase [Gammaproteobacteria bacterium]
MSWLQLEMALGGLDPRALEEALNAAGAIAVTFTDAADDPVYEPPPGAEILWHETRVTALFDPQEDRAALLAVLSKALAPASLPPHRFVELDDRDWAREWLKDFKPMRFGKRLWVCPTTYDVTEPEAVIVRLDPGLAFGTGSHPTTALCLEWLDGLAPAGRTLVDYGCGSGVLAIAAALLGARRVYAVDNDPQALLATRENAERNHVAARIQACAPEDLGTIQADALVANILARPLVTLAPRFAQLLVPGGVIALSGVLIEQVNEVAAAYRPHFDLATPVTRDDWARIDGVKR